MPQPLEPRQAFSYLGTPRPITPAGTQEDLINLKQTSQDLWINADRYICLRKLFSFRAKTKSFCCWSCCCFYLAWTKVWYSISTLDDRVGKTFTNEVIPSLPIFLYIFLKYIYSSDYISEQLYIAQYNFQLIFHIKSCFISNWQDLKCYLWALCTRTVLPTFRSWHTRGSYYELWDQSGHHI